MKNGELQTTDLSKLHEMYDEASSYEKTDIAKRITNIAADIASRDKALAEVEKFKAQSMDVVISDTKLKKAAIWAMPVVYVIGALAIAICVVTSIAGVAWIDGYWEYHQRR